MTERRSHPKSREWYKVNEEGSPATFGGDVLSIDKAVLQLNTLMDLVNSYARDIKHLKEFIKEPHEEQISRMKYEVGLEMLSQYNELKKQLDEATEVIRENFKDDKKAREISKGMGANLMCIIRAKHYLEKYNL